MIFKIKFFKGFFLIFSLGLLIKNPIASPPVVSMNSSRATFDDDGHLYISVTNGSDLEIRSLNRKGQIRMNWALNGSLLFNKGLYENEAEKTIALMKCDKFGNLGLCRLERKT